MITKEYLRNNPDHIFVFGDNLLRKGLGGAAALRNEPNTYGFITKKKPDNKDSSFYRVDEYKYMFDTELEKLIQEIESNSDKVYLISKLGNGLANKYKIYDMIIKHGINILKNYSNVRFV